MTSSAGSRQASCLPGYRAVSFSRGRLRLLDQTLLPQRERYLELATAAAVARAIKRLSVRGAPSIGVAAAYGLVVEAGRLSDKHLRAGLERAARLLAKARPTAVNLGWAVERMRAVTALPGLEPRALRARLRTEARQIEAEEVAHSLAMARHGARLVPNRGTVMTICNTGPLAGPGLGTALGVVLEARRLHRMPRVFACETRPLLQGSRLTTWELLKAGVDVTLICDSAAADVLERCDIVLVGADRVAANGDTANKVGTRGLALLSRAARKSFYVVAPSSTFDSRASTGSEIVLEERDPDEVRRFRRCPAAPAGVRVYNPAFDVTPSRLISGFVTELGVVRPPFRQGIRRLLALSRR